MTGTTEDRWERFFAAVEDALPDALRLRRELHREPRISGEEGPTLELVLEELGSPAWDPVAETGGLVRIGPADGPAIALRAELDALPIVEESGAAFASTNGAMHACGHDVHIAAAVAVARAAQQVQLPVALLLILQPREEAYPSGARDICESGLLEQHGVREVFGAHVHPRVPAGGVAVGEGAVNAAADEFGITVRGVGGHAAYPHHARDPIVAMAAVIGALQTLVSRRTDPMHPAVLSFGTVNAGSAANVIPAEAHARGSIRTMDADDRAFLHTALREAAASIAAAHGCRAEVTIVSGEPVLYNDPAVSRALRRALEDRGVRLVDPMRSCGADDFSYYTERLPGTMMFVGVAEGDDEPALHTSTFLPREEAVSDIAMAYATSIRVAYDSGLCVGAEAGSSV
ncbi:amidohydrolase [Leucobacter weissii]|uniref:Amidohydrolase n=1 Tax=Leucobacter weissii TaxID=1983706 RepID=A0A939MNQ3_9MICO|nr:M20 family metallopeptidase [Leucobacter weissii]MBO1901806.1 amidohydrolase [Leucobacter weissii]